MKEVLIEKEPIELCKLLKLENLVSCGGDAKAAIADGQVLVNGQVETRKRRKILFGDIVEFANQKLKVVSNSESDSD